MTGRPSSMLVLLLVAGAALAGCVDPPAPDRAETPAPSELQVDPDRPDPRSGTVATGPAAGPDLDATTAAAPRLVRGEWWRIRFSSSYFGDVPDLVRVVADVRPDGYTIGMPHEGWFKEVIAYHFPAFGDVNPDLSYDTHNVRFVPLQFPLRAGDTWESSFGESPMIATVESADEHAATIRIEPPPSEPTPTDTLFALLVPMDVSPAMRIVYDARQHEVVKFESAFLNWEVVEHGYDFEGWVTVPRGMHTAIDHGQFLPATLGGPVVTRTAEVAGGFNRLTLLQAIFPLGPGAYRVRAVAPDGTEFVTESIPGREFTAKFHEAPAPDGTWTLEDVVGGPGATFSMGMAYHQFDIRLPDGARRSDHSHPVMR